LGSENSSPGQRHGQRHGHERASITWRQRSLNLHRESALLQLSGRHAESGQLGRDGIGNHLDLIADRCTGVIVLPRYVAHECDEFPVDDGFQDLPGVRDDGRADDQRHAGKPGVKRRRDAAGVQTFPAGVGEDR